MNIVLKYLISTVIFQVTDLNKNIVSTLEMYHESKSIVDLSSGASVSFDYEQRVRALINGSSDGVLVFTKSSCKSCQRAVDRIERLLQLPASTFIRGSVKTKKYIDIDQVRF